MDSVAVIKSLRNQNVSIDEKKRLQNEYGLPQLFCFEIASRCMLDCEFCLYPRDKIHKSRRNSFLSFQDFRWIIDCVHPFTHYIQLSGGEPLLNPELPEMIRYAREKSINPWLFTNLQMVNKHYSLADIIDARPWRIVIALDALESGVYESIRRRGDYERLISNIKELVRAKKASGQTHPIISLQMVLTKKNMQFEKDFVTFAQELGADNATVKPLGVWPEGDEEYCELMRKEYLIEEGKHPLVRNFLDEKNNIISRRQPGQCTSTTLGYIGSGGEVIPCWYIQVRTEIMGNAVDEDFVDIWFSDKYRAYRETMLNDWANPLCTKCLSCCPSAAAISKDFDQAS